MPIHDWKKVSAGTYHDFHHEWISAMRRQLNAGLLPEGLFAMAEQIIGGPAPDVITLQDWPQAPDNRRGNGSTIALAEPAAPPKSTYVWEHDAEEYVAKKSQLVIKHDLGRVLAVIELVSPGNKHSNIEIRRLVEKSAGLIGAGINLLLIDPFPPTVRDPNGLPALIWEELYGPSDFRIPDSQTLTVASFQATPVWNCKDYIEPLKVGQSLPTMPLFIVEERYISLPLEDSYKQTWEELPLPIQRIVAPEVPNSPK